MFIPLGTVQTLPVGSHVVTYNGYNMSTASVLSVRTARDLDADSTGKLLAVAPTYVTTKGTVRAQDGTIYTVDVDTTLWLPKGTQISGTVLTPVPVPPGGPSPSPKSTYSTLKIVAIGAVLILGTYLLGVIGYGHSTRQRCEEYA